jgi:di/tricarboxylate transporter
MTGIVLFIIAMILSIVIGLKFNICAGIPAFISAMLIGCLVVELSPENVFALWPNKLFLTLLFVMFFFGFAVSNGTLDMLALHIIWLFRKIPALIPFVLFFFIMALASAGMSTYALFAFLGPFVIIIASKLNIHRVVAACVVQGGASIGGFTIISQLGATTMNTLINVGYGVEEAKHILHIMHMNMFIGQGGMMVLCYFLFKGYKATVLYPRLPGSFTIEQRKTIGIFIGVLAVIVFFALMHALLPENTVLKKLYTGFDITVMALLGVICCAAVKAAKIHDAMKKIPMNTLILVCGVSTLISVGVKAGAVDMLSSWAAVYITGIFAPYFMVIVSGVFSLFASSINIVVPTMGTMIPGLAAAHGLTPGYLFSLSACMATLAGYSPFSTAGGSTISGIFDEKERDRLFKWLLVIPFMALTYILVLTFFGLFFK